MRVHIKLLVTLETQLIDIRETELNKNYFRLPRREMPYRAATKTFRRFLICKCMLLAMNENLLLFASENLRRFSNDYVPISII